MMSFKRISAIALALTVLAASLNVNVAAAKDTKSSDAVVASFTMSGVVSPVTNEKSAVLVKEDSGVESISATDQIKLDQKDSDEKAKKEAEEAKEKQLKAEKKAKKEYEKNLKLLATIIYCEAGNQCYAGRLAVGAVVMNRVKSPGFPNTVKAVIWQPYQFGPVRQGKMKREMKNYDKGLYKYPERSGSLKAAKDILDGKYLVEYKGKTVDLKKYTNFNGHLSNAKIRISGHDFA